MKVIHLATAPFKDHTAASAPGLVRYVVDNPDHEVDTSGYVIRAEVAAVITAVFDPRVAPATFTPALPGDAYLVEEFVQWDYDRSWPDGVETPGIKQISFLKRLPGTSRADFAEHWTAIHTHLARKHHPTIWRYVQNVVIDGPAGSGSEIDGIAELSFRTVGDWRDRKFDSEEGRQVIASDVRTFIDVGSLSHRITRETIVRSPETS